MHRTIRILALAALSLLSAAAHAAERWYVVQLDGARAGWSRETTTTEDNRITSTNEMKMVIRRMGEEVTVHLSTEFIETAAGDPISMKSVQELGAATVTDTYTFIPGIAIYEILHVTESPAGRTEKKLPWPPGAPGTDWFSPAAAAREVERRIAAGEKNITITTFDPTTGIAPVTITSTILHRDIPIEVFGKTVSAIEWTTTTSAMPGIEAREYVDHTGETLRAEIDFGGMKMLMLTADKELALSDFDAPEMMAQSLVKPEKGATIEHPRRAAAASYILSRKDGKPMPDLPTIGAQTVERLDELRLRITIQRDRRSPFDADPPDAAHPTRAASTMINFSDPAVRGILELNNLIGSAPSTDHERDAIQITRLVTSFIDDESLGVGFATASEVARSRRGDCTEHAVLLAALLRVKGIPSRVVSGLVYVPTFGDAQGVFGFHMWTQTLICEDGNCQWLDLDAAIPAPESQAHINPEHKTWHPGVDATHIALSASEMSDGEMVNTMAALIPLIANLKIEIERIENLKP